MLIRMPTWFWLDPGHAGPRSATARLDGLWARATATPFRVSIDPGDGSPPVVCDAPGVSYTDDHTRADEDAACTHAYTDPGDYQVRVTVSWAADWAGSDGGGGTLPTLDRATTFTLHVVEARSELIHGP